MALNGVFILSIFIGLTNAIAMNIPSGFPVELVPRTGPEGVGTLWKLTSCGTCKLALNCEFMTKSCKTSFLVVDYGAEEMEEVCPDYSSKVSVISIRNSMNVTINHWGPYLGIRCKVAATVPFLDQEDTRVVSAEYGLENRKTEKPTCRCGWTNKSPQRIVGGSQAGLHEFPFVVRLKEVQKGTTFCGGAIVTKRHIVTAAHCIQPRRKIPLSVLVGEHDLTTKHETNATVEIGVLRYHIHPEYSPFKPLKDLALLVLKESIKYNDLVGPVCMPKAQKDLLGHYIKVLGWGRTRDMFEGGQSSPILKKVNLKVIDSSVCKVIYDIDSPEESVICTYSKNKDSCSGDSGGPVISLNEKTNMYSLVAAVSLGRRCASTDPAMNTDVAYFLGWLKYKIEETEGVEICY